MRDFLNENKDDVKKLLDFIKSNNLDKNDLIKVLYEAQRIFGYLPKEVIEIVSKVLHLPTSKVYGVVSFYSYFNMERKGKNTIDVCLGTACFVKGADKVLGEFEKRLGIKCGDTTKDGNFTLCNLRCVGACGLAPVVMVNEKVYPKVSVDMVQGIIDEYKGES